MARGGFLRRIGRAIRRVVAPSPPPSPPQRRAPEPPTEREPRGAYRDIWREQGGGRKYQQHLNLFHNAIDPIESDPQERLELWESYAKYMVHGEGRFRRNSAQNMFWRDSGIDPIDFNWASWREAMGFTGKRRSRS